MTKTQAKQLVVCIENNGYAVSLEKRKIYVALRDASAEKHNMVRIIDESGDDYLYPRAFFRSIALPQAVKRAVLAA
jgi:TPP-dependent pyruvate/acetoin dehydrogenase alpha subunit